MANYCLIPALSSQAGSCLTIENWQQAGATHGVYYLEALLTKPGSRVLQDFNDLRSYTAWPGTLILNACLHNTSATGDYLVRSPYDGSLLTISTEDLFALISHLQADYVVWPTHITDNIILCEEKCKFLVPGANDLANNGSVFYCMDNVTFAQAQSLAKNDAALSIWLESDQPAFDALQAKVYSSAGIFNLLEPIYQQAFVPLDEACGCYTCQQGYTRAYLHHLFQHTPLLAQRFLILHNYNFFSCNLRREVKTTIHAQDLKN